MCIWRWMRDPRVRFPAPVKINNRNYWRVGDLRRWQAERAAEARNAPKKWNAPEHRGRHYGGGPNLATRRWLRCALTGSGFASRDSAGARAMSTASTRRRQKVKPAPDRRRSQQGEQQQVLLFARDESSLYTNLAILPQRAGVPDSMLPLLVAKEFCDNALDSADAAGRPGAVEIGVDHHGNLIVDDQGTGIPGATPEQIACLFCVARPWSAASCYAAPPGAPSAPGCASALVT
jgi:hypothetical protein